MLIDNISTIKYFDGKYKKEEAHQKIILFISGGPLCATIIEIRQEIVFTKSFHARRTFWYV